jgi:hypothetical protein
MESVPYRFVFCCIFFCILNVFAGFWILSALAKLSMERCMFWQIKRTRKHWIQKIAQTSQVRAIGVGIFFWG